jgi:hypothetical protein
MAPCRSFIESLLPSQRLNPQVHFSRFERLLMTVLVEPVSPRQRCWNRRDLLDAHLKRGCCDIEASTLRQLLFPSSRGYRRLSTSTQQALVSIRSPLTLGGPSFCLSTSGRCLDLETRNTAAGCFPLDSDWSCRRRHRPARPGQVTWIGIYPELGESWCDRSNPEYLRSQRVGRNRARRLAEAEIARLGRIEVLCERSGLAERRLPRPELLQFIQDCVSASRRRQSPMDEILEHRRTSTDCRTFTGECGSRDATIGVGDEAVKQ